MYVCVCYALYIINQQQIHVYITVCHLQGDVLQKQMFTTRRETNYLQLVSTLYGHMPYSLVRPWKYYHIRAVATLLVLSPHHGGMQKVFVSEVYLVPSAGHGRESGDAVYILHLEVRRLDSVLCLCSGLL